ncbi:hypothetical protein BGZ76_002628 [Entomortierella beljakovae]|nr:hypothetical protein BGZ76_002628 [Entomortierella beljakovae]
MSTPDLTNNTSAPSISEGIGHVETSNMQQSTTQQVLLRPWWRPPPRNFRANPSSINSHIVPRAPVEVSSSSSAIHSSVYSESLHHFWLRSFAYILRIPFRELVGNIARPYDPTTASPLPDVPLTTVLVDTQSHQTFLNPYTSRPPQRTNHDTTDGVMPGNTTTNSQDYLAQIRKGWKDRTPDMSWALSTACFTIAASALIINWQEECTYLKVYMVVFVVRKWIVTFIMIDRALYRLPLGLTEPDADIDEERHNGVAIYMTQLRRAISRRNGGYQSNGTTNTTDLREIERAIEDADNGESGGGFGRTESVKITPAMTAIPIVIFKKPVEMQSGEAVCDVTSTSQHISIDNTSVEHGKDETSEDIEMTTESLSIKDKMKGIFGSSDTKSESNSQAIDSEPMEIIIPIDDIPKNPLTDEAPQTSSGATIANQQKSDSCGKFVTISIEHEESNNDNESAKAKDKDNSSTASNECLKPGSTKLSESWSSNDLSKYPVIADEECAICLYDFEDGDELRHLYCDHFFHRNCVDRWLSKNPHCPKCKRAI